MPESFQQGGDHTPNGQDDQSFSKAPDDNSNASTDGESSTLQPDALAALQKRDEHAQSHITTLETEAADLKTLMVEMQEKLDKAAQVEELLRNKPEGSEFNLDDVTSKTTEGVLAALDARSLKEKADSNFDTVSTALTKQYGDKTDEAVKKACAENDMSFDEMIALSRKNPKLAMKLCDVDVKPDQQPSRTTINSSAVLNQYQQQDEAPKVNVMDLRTDRERVTDYERRLEAKIKQLNK